MLGDDESFELIRDILAGLVARNRDKRDAYGNAGCSDQSSWSALFSQHENSEPGSDHDA